MKKKQIPHPQKARVRDDNACPWTTLSRDRSRQWQHTRASLRAGQRIFEAVEFGAEVGSAFGDCEIEHKEYAPTNDVGGEDAVEIFYLASTSPTRKKGSGCH